ncbi:hypothetical protein FACS1894166_00120 [Bacilli bacterium]|nr:hypothetical protein FACS1894166_00120 [Bacilli bacterium]
MGLGASGFNIKSMYVYVGSLNKYTARVTSLSTKDYYFQIMMMGLRLNKGLDLSISRFQHAYKYFKDKLKHVHVKNNYLYADNINLLDNILLELM